MRDWITPAEDQVLTATRSRHLTVTAGHVVLARPTSLHGAAVFCKRMGSLVGPLTVRYKGVPICPTAKFTLEPEWRQYLC